MATLPQLLEMPQPQELQTKFVVQLPEELAVTLHQWYWKAGVGEVGDIHKFVSQVLECALADFRLEHLPLGEEGSRNVNRLTDAEKDEMCELYQDPDDVDRLSAVELAQRFKISRTTVRRILEERGMAKKKKMSLCCRPAGQDHNA